MLVKNINKNIQEMMKAKEIALSKKSAVVYAEDGSREQAYSFDFTDMASRSVFIRMVSNRNPDELEIIQGGDLGFTTDDVGNVLDVKTKFGYNQVYRKKSDGQIRPISGIKDISVEYKGGYKAIRTADINWSVSSLDDLNRFLPHFLTIGQSVLLDWGWIYKNKEVQNNLKTFFNPQTNIIDPSVFDNPMPLIYRNNGNYDAIGGVISNMSYKLNESGGFDCTTTITTVGLSLFQSKRLDTESDILDIKQSSEETTMTPADGVLNAVLNLPGIIFHEFMGIPQKKISWLREKLTAKRTLYGQIQRRKSGEDYGIKDPLKVFYELYNAAGQGSNTDAYGESQYHYIDNYVLCKLGQAPVEGVDPKSNGKIDVVISKLQWSDNYEYGDGALHNVRNDMFVRWGWFEDNILSRYTSYIDSDEKLLNVFRSVEPLISEDNKLVEDDGELVLRDVRITNDPFYLLPVDPLRFFLPGQVVSSDYISPNANRYEKGEFGNVDDATPDSKWRDYHVARAFDTLMSVNYGNDYSFKAPESDGKYGILRNVMINVKEIQKAFGISGIDDYSIYGEVFGTDVINPPPDIKTAMMNLCKALSENYHGYWNYEIVEDPFNHNIKIIEKDSISGLSTRAYTKFDESFPSKVNKIGIFKFPSFKRGSFVKSQDLEFKIPNSMAVSALYGTNKNKNRNNVIDTRENGSGLEALNIIQNKTTDNKDKKFKNMKPAVSEGNSHKIGNSNKVNGSIANQRLEKDGSFKIDASDKSLWWNRYSPKSAESHKEVERLSEEEKRQAINERMINEANANLLWSNFAKQMRNILSKNPEDESKVSEINQNIKILQNNDDQAALERIGELKKELLTASQRYYTILPGDDEDFEFNLFPPGVALLKTQLFSYNQTSVDFKKDILIPAELSLEIDGISGITPGDICQTDYIPETYTDVVDEQPVTFFQLFNINQKVDSSGWSTELNGKMRINTRTLKNLLGHEPIIVTGDVSTIAAETAEEQAEDLEKAMDLLDFHYSVVQPIIDFGDERVKEAKAFGSSVKNKIGAEIDDGIEYLQEATGAVKNYTEEKLNQAKTAIDEFEAKAKEKIGKKIKSAEDFFKSLF